MTHWYVLSCHVTLWYILPCHVTHLVCTAMSRDSLVYADVSVSGVRRLVKVRKGSRMSKNDDTFLFFDAKIK